MRDELFLSNLGSGEPIAFKVRRFIHLNNFKSITIADGIEFHWEMA